MLGIDFSLCDELQDEDELVQRMFPESEVFSKVSHARRWWYQRLAQTKGKI